MNFMGLICGIVSYCGWIWDYFLEWCGKWELIWMFVVFCVWGQLIGCKWFFFFCICCSLLLWHNFIKGDVFCSKLICNLDWMYMYQTYPLGCFWVVNIVLCQSLDSHNLLFPHCVDGSPLWCLCIIFIVYYATTY